MLATLLPALAGVLRLLAGPGLPAALLLAGLLLAGLLLAALLVLRILVLLRHVTLHVAARGPQLAINCGAGATTMWRSPDLQPRERNGTCTERG